MADSDIATRAPESDAQEQPAAEPTVEQSVFPGDTRAQEGPTMGVSSRVYCEQAAYLLLRTTARQTAQHHRERNHQAKSPNSVA
jgi:hypothetical protein